MSSRVPTSTETVGLHTHAAAQRITTLSPNTDKDINSTPKRTLAWKGTVEHLLGFPVDDIPTTESWWLARIHPDDLLDVVTSLSKILAPAPERPYASEARIWAHNYRFRHAGGEYLLVAERSTVDRDEGGNVLSMTSTIFDAEKRRVERKAHREFLDERNQFALVANNTPSGIWMMDPQGYTTYMNNAAESITGFKFEEIAGWTFHAAVHSCKSDGSPYPVSECPIFRHQQSGTEAKNESETFVHKDGHHYDIVYSVSPIGDYASGGAVIEFRDVTSQKKLERERLAAIVQNEQQSVLIKASEDHKANMASFVSFVCHELRNPLQGITSSTEFLSETLEKLEALTNTLSTGSSASKSVSDGVSDASLTEVNGHKPKPADDQTAQSMLDLVTYAKELVSNIATCASHQALITNNVLDLSRLDAGKVEPSYDIVDLRALSKEAVGMMASRARVKSINLRLADDDGAPLYLEADSTLMSQVLLNLIGNAVKFTPENGNIVVKINSEQPDKDGRVVFHGSVTDDGVGMTEAEQQRLFKRFSQANKRVAQTYKGSGLGLSISKEIVKVLGGDMSVTSSPGLGSTFSWTTIHKSPSRQELTSHLESAASETTNVEKYSIQASTSTHTPTLTWPSPPPPKFKRICVAEDNPINLRHLAKNLETLGYEYVLCVNGQEALDSFRRADSDIDAVIIDMSMPVMDGLEATRLMREYEDETEQREKGGKEGEKEGGKEGGREGGKEEEKEEEREKEEQGKEKGSDANSRRPLTRRTPIIALSGNAMREQVQEAMAAGTSDYMIKPCKRAQLLSMLNHWERIQHQGSAHTPLVVK